MNPITPTDNKLIFASENFVRDNTASPTETAQSQPALETTKPADEPSAKQPKTATSSRESPSSNLLSAAVSEMNEFVQSIQRELHFTIDEDSGRTVVKVIDKSTNEVIRQVPPEDLLAMLKEFSKPAQPGLIFKNSA